MQPINSTTRLGRFPAAILLALAATGCQKADTSFREVKRIHEKISETELQRYLRVIEQLPERRVPGFVVFRPLPNWKSQRTLPVDELVREEQKLLDRAWDVEWHTGHLRRNRDLLRVLNRENITLRQFAGLTLAIGAALSRGQLREDQSLEEMIKRGRAETAMLLKDKRTFANLTPDERFSVHRKAAWLTRLDRASRLSDVPPENVMIVDQHRNVLARIFPKEFLENPLDGIADLLEEKGTPFEQLDSSGRDEDLTWDPNNAIIGYDKPDAPKRP